MKKGTVTILSLILVLCLAGCAGPAAEPERDKPDTTAALTEQTEPGTGTPDFHYTKSLYNWDYSSNNFEGAYLLVEGVPWDGYPPDLPLIGGYMDLGLGGGKTGDRQYMLVFTRGGDDGEIANWYRQRLEDAGWDVTDFEISEQYGSTRFKFSNNEWNGDFLAESEEAALGGYDGAMSRSESDFEKAAVVVSINSK